MDLGTLVKKRALGILKPRATVESQNVYCLYQDIAWYGFLFAAIQAFLPVYAIRLGGSDMHVGLITALPALILMILSMPGSQLVEHRNPLTMLIITAIIQRSGYLIIALVPFFFATNSADAVVALVGLLTIPLAIAAVAFTAMFARAVKPEHRAHVVSIRNVWLGITMTAMTLIGGRFLDLVVFPLNFQILFAFACAASMVSAYYLTRIRLPDAPTPQQHIHVSARAMLAMIIADRAFMRYTITLFIFHWGLFFAVPLFSIYWVRNLGASDGWIGVINMVMNATTIICYPLWGRLAARRGNRRVLVWTTLGLAAIPPLTAFAPSVEWILVVSVIGGIASSGFTLAFFNGFLEVCPEQNRATFIGAFNALINVTIFIGPILSTALAAVISIQALLIVSGVLRLGGALLIWQTRVSAKIPHSA